MNTLREVLRDVRAGRTRTALTALSMFFAITAMIAIVCVSAVARDVFVAQEEQANGRAPTVGLALPEQDLSGDALAAILRGLSRAVVAGGGSYAVQIALDGRAGPVEATTAGQVLPQAAITGVAGRLDEIRRLPILAGRWLHDNAQTMPAEILENQAAAASNGGIGTVLAVQTAWHGTAYPARVVGVLADGVTTPTLYTSLTSVVAYDPGALDGAAPAQLLVHVQANEERARAMLQRAATLIGLDTSTIEITRTDHVADLARRLADQRAGFLIASLVALVIAVLGLVNIGLAGVRERSRELVVRRALGATRARLFALVLLSTVLISLVTCAASIALAIVGVDLLVPHLLSRTSALAAPAFPWTAALAGLAAAVAGAITGAGYPAMVAARLDVANALRE